MNHQTERLQVDGPSGRIEATIDRPAPGAPVRGLALVAHPHPLHGGTLDNKVVQTLARAHVLAGFVTWRFNVRGVGASEGAWDEGRGELDDAGAVLAAAESRFAAEGGPSALALAGFSFGSYLAARLTSQRVAAGRPPVSTVLVGPAVVNFPVDLPPAASLVVHGSDDEVVPLQAVLGWARPAVQPVLVLPGVGHFFHGQLPLLRQCVLSHLNFLAE